MPRCFKTLLPATVAVLLVFGFFPTQAAAQAEATAIIGYLLGSDIDPDPGDGVSRNFESGLAWGVRGGYSFKDQPMLGLEGSFTQAPLSDINVGSDTFANRVTYGDFNMVVQGTNPDRRPYLTIGLGITSFRMGASDGGQTHRKLGANIGVGIKLLMWEHTGGGKWGLRFDARNHMHRMDADDSMRSNFKNALALPHNSTSSINNIVTTLGFYFTF